MKKQANLHGFHARPEAHSLQLTAGVLQAQACAVVLQLYLQVVHLLAVVAAPVSVQPQQPLLQRLILVHRDCVELLAHCVYLEHHTHVFSSVPV